MTFAITLIILGILAAPSLLLSKKPDAKELLDKIEPYQGWIGLVFCFWGLWGVVQAIMSLSLFASAPVVWVLWLATVVLMALLGFILGYGMINKHLLSKNEEAKAKGEELLAKLRPIQGKLGLAGIILGVFYLLTSIM